MNPGPADPGAEWQAALAAVDAAFSPPPVLRPPVSGCTYCLPESELQMLGGDPAAVPHRSLTHFMREVVDHWDEGQYPILWRRLMPRALRVWAGSGSGIDHAHEMSRLARYGAGFADWPDGERAAVERAFRALLHIAVTDGRPAAAAAELVEGIAHASGRLQPWLGYLAGLRGREADAGLVRLTAHWAERWVMEDLKFEWWYDGDPQVIADWLPAQRDRIARFAAAHTRCKTAADALVAIDCLRTGEPDPWVYPEGRPCLSLADGGGKAP